MDDILERYGSAKSELAPFLTGVLTRSSLATALAKIRDITRVIASQIPASVKDDLTRECRMCIPPKDLPRATLTAATVVESLLATMLIDEYFAALVGQPRLKMQFWKQLEKDGVNFAVWAGVRRAIQG